jgi:hypothetical protein
MLTSLEGICDLLEERTEEAANLFEWAFGNCTPRAHQPVGWCFRSVLLWLWSGNSARIVVLSLRNKKAARRTGRLFV